MPITALAVTSEPYKRCIGSLNAIGAKCSPAGAARVRSPGRFSRRSKPDGRYSNHAWHSPIGSSKHLLCCEPCFEERSAGNRHAAFCGSRRRVTASDDPVLGVRFPRATHPTSVWYYKSMSHSPISMAPPSPKTLLPHFTISNQSISSSSNSRRSISSSISFTRSEFLNLFKYQTMG